MYFFSVVGILYGIKKTSPNGDVSLLLNECKVINLQILRRLNQA